MYIDVLSPVASFYYHEWAKPTIHVRLTRKFTMGMQTLKQNYMYRRYGVLIAPKFMQGREPELAHPNIAGKSINKANVNN